MSRLHALLVIAVLPFLLLSEPGVCVELPSVITLANGEWAPYQSAKLKHQGVASRIVREAFETASIKVNFVFLPWKRGFEETRKGKHTGTFLWFDTPERRKDFLISNPILDVKYVFFHLKKTPFSWKEIKDLKGHQIGATLGFDYGKAFQDAEKKGVIQVDRSAKGLSGFRMLLAKRIDLFPYDLDAGLDLIANQFAIDEVSQFTWHPLPVRAAPHHLLISRKAAGADPLLKEFNRGLERLQEAGKIKRYIEESRKGEYRP
ncbi:MAG: substrate-binding periplasmic protein [Planctomycetota bacterium]|jgi:polar amino acid transport system substrate-binding protein